MSVLYYGERIDSGAHTLIVSSWAPPGRALSNSVIYVFALFPSRRIIK